MRQSMRYSPTRPHDHACLPACLQVFHAVICDHAMLFTGALGLMTTGWLQGGSGGGGGLQGGGGEGVMLGPLLTV